MELSQMINNIHIDEIHLAKPRGFCAGVVMAIDAVKDAASALQDEGELTVYHAIVHNNTVVERLEQAHNVHFVEDIAEIPELRENVAAKGGNLHDTVVFSAHGISPQIREQAAQHGLATIDATCPLVTKVHHEAKKYAAKGYHILLIGDSSKHQEIKGTRGHAPEQTTVISVLGNTKDDPKLADPYTVSVPDPDNVVVLTQTTLSVDDVYRTIDVLKERFPNLVVPPSDDLCYATKNRQDAVKAIASKVDLFLVVTSTHSSNGMRLYDLAHKLMGNAQHIESVTDIQASWLDGIKRIGITSAASTPDDLVQEIVALFQQGNSSLQVIEEGEWEKFKFRKPKRVPAPVL